MIDLEHSYNVERKDLPELSRLEFLADYIFGFTTYAKSYSELFTAKALEVCAAISAQHNFKYIENDENHQWYLLMVNMPFFENKLNWGTSIRGAWWDHQEFQLVTCGLWDGDTQVIDPTFTYDEWLVFIDELIAFSKRN